MAVFDIVWYVMAGFGQPLQCDGCDEKGRATLDS